MKCERMLLEFIVSDGYYKEERWGGGGVSDENETGVNGFEEIHSV